MLQQCRHAWCSMSVMLFMCHETHMRDEKNSSNWYAHMYGIQCLNTTGYSIWQSVLISCMYLVLHESLHGSAFATITRDEWFG